MTLARDAHSLLRDRLLVHATSAKLVLDQLYRSRDGGADAVRLVMLDPALTASVVRAANSAHLGYSRRISGLRQAAVMLGGTLVASLAAGRVADLVFDSHPPEYPDWLWPHSVSVACACTVLAKRTGASVDDAYTAGLLHDIGWLLAASNGTSLEHNDVDHARTGSELLSRWNYPDHIVQAVGLHHAKPDALVSLLDRIVVAAHGLAKGMGVPSPESAVSKLEALRLVELSDVRASVVMNEIEQELESVTSILKAVQ